MCVVVFFLRRKDLLQVHSDLHLTYWWPNHLVCIFVALLQWLGAEGAYDQKQSCSCGPEESWGSQASFFLLCDDDIISSFFYWHRRMSLQYLRCRNYYSIVCTLVGRHIPSRITDIYSLHKPTSKKQRQIARCKVRKKKLSLGTWCFVGSNIMSGQKYYVLLG